MARPTKFNENLAETIYELYRKGKTDKQVAEIIGISEKTINNWKGKNPKFLHTLKEAKMAADELVEAALFRKAIGYSHKAVKIFQHEGETFEHMYVEQYAPDTTAAIFWLKNRQPEKWREKQTPDPGDQGPLTKQTDEDLDKRIKELLAKQEKK